MRLDADEEEAFPRHPAPASAASQQIANERPVSQDTDSTEAEAHTAVAVTRELEG